MTVLATALTAALARKATASPQKPEPKGTKLSLGPQPERPASAQPSPPPPPVEAQKPEPAAPPLPNYRMRVTEIVCVEDRPWLGTASVELVITGTFGLDIHHILLFPSRSRPGVAVRFPYRREDGKAKNSVWLHSPKVAAEIAEAVNAAWRALPEVKCDDPAGGAAPA
jgi:hypothetical protein